ncbi:MAG TPA: hypothetical protein VN132_15020, partial [Bdellovibrio sp.]|nr:hypothetical protein [Bdellovibrio sp.]
EKLADTREKNREQISEAQEHSKERVQEIQNHAQEEVTNIHAKSENDVRAAKQRYNKDMQDINAYGEKRLKHEKDQNELALHNEMERGRISQEKVHERNDTQLSQLRQKGEKQLVNEQEVQAQKLQRSDAEAARRYQINQEQWASKEKNLDHQYTQRLGDNKQSYEKQLHTQGEHFKSTYKKNEEAERESLDIQQDLYNREIADNHKKFLKASEKYTNKESDPFYKVQDRGSHLQDGGDFYVLRAYVPEHEKDAVKVSIQKDHATISGQRSFKDKLDDGSKSVSTNSFQTFREEFPFEKPIITEGMTREREGDWVVYKIPVMSSLGFTRKA